MTNQSAAVPPEPTAQARLREGVDALKAGNAGKALPALQQAVELRPDLAEAHHMRAVALFQLRRLDEALAAIDKALLLNPNSVDAHNNKAVMLLETSAFEAAIECCTAALKLRPDYPQAHANRGLALLWLKRRAEAVEDLDKAIARMPDPTFIHHRAVALQELGRNQEALQGFEDAVRRRADPIFELALMHLRQRVCDWRHWESDCARIAALAGSGVGGLPFVLRTVDATIEQMQRAGQTMAEHPVIKLNRPARSAPRTRIRIGYLSSDFQIHPVGRMIEEVVARHDRNRFEVFAYSTGVDDRSGFRQRLMPNFERFVDLAALADAPAAQLIAGDDLDILVDLNGLTKGARPGILAARPARVQVNALSYLGPIGKGRADYVIADPVVLPFEQQPWYEERIVHLRHCYLPAASMTSRPQARARKDYGLPEDAFVFCNFNHPYKITPVIFGIWMDLLREVPKSVLWLHADDPLAIANLGREAVQRGIAQSRLVFAPTLPVDQYIARFAHADLFLDTQPCSACTTGRDALTMGVPLVTITGRIFAGLHASSLLTSAGLPELIAQSPDEYRKIALRTASDPARLAQVRERLQRADSPLFDISGYVRDLEQAYAEMVRVSRCGGERRAFIVRQEP
jgi:predicted O-linked N-acetylglucosamine transferase (SPINDLY family)